MDVTRHAIPTETRAPTGRTNAYVVGRDPALLVDPAARADDLDAQVSDRGVEHVLVTHTHPDHVGAVGAYADDTGASVWSRRGRTERFHAATGIEPDRQFGPGETIPLGDGVVTLIDVPGHAPDHVALVVGSGGPILCGDCAIRDGSVVVGAPEGEMRAYLSSLRRLWAMDPPRLLPGHGLPIEQPRPTLERLLTHRAERERRVREAVAAGRETPEEILEEAYEKALSGVRDLARATVVAHLEKLAVEGDVEWDGERARVVRRSRERGNASRR